MVYVLWIRHGFSCGNYENLLKKEITSQDPLLTNLGHVQSQQAYGTILNQLIYNYNIEPFEVLFTSTLKRTIQTAENFNKAIVLNSTRHSQRISIMPIIPIPNVHEIYPGHPEYEYNSNFQESNNVFNVMEELNIDVKMSPVKELIPYNEDGDPKYSKDMKTFEELFPILYDYLESYSQSGNNDNKAIIVVSHGNRIMDLTGEIVANNGAVLQEFVNNKLGKSMVLFDGFINKLDDLEYDDVSNCS